MIPSFWFALSAHADVVQPPMDRGTNTVEVAAILPHGIDAVWDILAGDYGKISESHPKIVKSAYLKGSLQGDLGVERTCWFDDDGDKELHEQIVRWEPAAYTFDNRILAARGFPLDPDNTLATYHLEAIDATHTRAVIHMEYRTAPAMMGGMMKGAFRGLLSDYLVAVHGHLATGAPVNRENFDEVRQQYGDEVVFE